jgi:cell wall-associated NlpC family hydrolase
VNLEHKLFRIYTRYCFYNGPREKRFVSPFHQAKMWHSNRCRIFVHLVIFKASLGVAVFGALLSTTTASPFPSSGPTVGGSKARLHGKQAAAPENAPAAVKRAIWAANQLRSKPYRYGGGHASFVDRGYDCSGTVSYALGAAGVIKSPMSSSDLRRFGERGHGKWITVYARNGHTFAVIAGLRLDTTPYVTGRERWAPAWQPTFRAPHGFEARHPAGL